MTKRKKKSLLAGCLLIVGILFISFLVISPISKYKGFFIGLIVIGLIAFIIHKIYKSHPQRPEVNPMDTPPPERHVDISLIANPSLYVPSHRVSQPEYQWYGRGTQLRVGTYVINDPMTYYSISNPFDSSDESSCIYASLPIGQALDEGRKALGYWPHYSRITPNQRANYLDWLAGGRKGVLTDIGYAFIFFYGLERRSLIEKKDIGPVLQEVIYLLARYSQSGSFNSYLSNFIVYVVSRSGLDKINHEHFRFLFEKTPISSLEEGLAVGLAWLYKNSISLPTSWARKVAAFDPRTPKSVVVDRFPAKFSQLFSLKYKERFNKGMALNVLDKDRGIDYFPASSTLFSSIPDHTAGRILPTAVIPNVIGLQHQFDPIIDIWNECIEELKPFGRKVSKGISAGSRVPYESLPDELRKLTDHPDSSKWNKVIEKYTREDGFSIPKISSLAEIQGIEKRLSLTMKESIGLAETAGYMKLALEPDPRITKVPYKWDESVALYYPKTDRAITNNPQYVSASFILELGVSIAYADGFIDNKEVNQISQSLDYLFALDEAEVQRLNALKQVLIHQKPSLQNLRRRFQKTFSEADLEKLSGFLMSIANADGSISQNEVSVLKKMYKAFGIEPEKIKNLITELQAPPTEPVLVKESGNTGGVDEKIPERPLRTNSISLDKGKLEKLINDTNGVSTLIRRAMLESEMDNSTVLSPSVDGKINTVVTQNSGLDRKYYRVLAMILKTKKCERNIFEQYVRECGVMPNAAMDAINDWSFVRFGQNLIKDGDLITVNDSIYLRIRNELNHQSR